MTLTEFSEGLFRRLPGGRDSTHRPFVCDGSPLDCSTFIVGFNNAHGIGPFRQVWSDHTGFKMPTFKKLFEQSGGAPDDKRTNRYWINLISKAVGHCVETNMFSADTRRAHSFSRNSGSTEVFDYIFKSVKPSALFCFNAQVIEILEARLNVPIPLISDRGKLLQVTMFDHCFHIIGHDHGRLSTAEPYIDGLVDQLRSHRERGSVRRTS